MPARPISRLPLLLALALAAPAQDPLAGVTRRLPGERMRASSGLFDPESNLDAFRIEPGETQVLADLAGPGEIQHIWFTINSYDRRAPRSCVLRIYWDGFPEPAVETPVGDFFAAGHGMKATVTSLPVEVTSYGRALNCYWRMPFHSRAKVTMTNESDKLVTSCYFYIDWVKLAALPPESLYFHARYRQEYPVKPFTPYTICEVEGGGHYVGTVMSLHACTDSWFGESDDLFFIDGEAEPRLVGTGYEDYFTDAWNLRLFSNPSAGVTIREWNSEDARITCYRWHLRDPILFSRALKVQVERRSYVRVVDPATGQARQGDFKYRPDFCSSVAFWYQGTVAGAWPFPPLEERVMPEVWIEPRQLADRAPEAGGARTSGPGIRLRKVSNRVSFRKEAVRIDNESVGAWIEFPAAVPAAGRYSISIFPILFRENGIWKVTLRGPGVDRVLHPALDAWDPWLAWKENYPENEVFGTLVERKLGVLDLQAGEHAIRLECVGSHPFARDDAAGGPGLDLRLDAISIRRLPWGDMNAWYDDYLAREKELFAAREAEAARTVAALAAAVAAFRADLGFYPPDLNTLVEKPAALNRSWGERVGRWPYYSGGKIPMDPWGQHYRYLAPGRRSPDGFDLWSVHGNSRDPKVWIGNWPPGEPAGGR